MAELVEGTYAIISAQSSLALDVKGQSDKSGANVMVYTVSTASRDSQVWTAATRSSGKWQFLCPLTGKYLFVKDGKVANGSNVQQGAYNSKASQTWDVVDAGSTKTYKGTSYPCYYIKNAKNNTYVLSEASNTAGSNVKLATFSSGAASQKWIFVNQPIFKTDGTYSIEQNLAPDDYVTVRSDSTANNATIGFTTFQDRNSQIFKIDYNDTTGLAKFTAAHSNKVLSTKGNKSTDGTPIVQLPDENNSGQKFLIRRVGSSPSSIRDGETLPCYELRIQAGVDMLVEPIDETMKVSPRYNDAYQRWVFHRAEMESSSLTAPTELSPSLFVYEYSDPEISPVGNLTFQSKFDKFQARMQRVRYDYSGTVAVRSPWININDVSGADWEEDDVDNSAREGWGDAWEETFTATPGTITLPFSYSYYAESGLSYRKIETIIEVRAFSNNVNGFIAHGPAKRTTVKSIFKPSLSVESMEVFYDSSSNRFGIKTSFSVEGKNGDPYINYFNIVRCRIVDSNGRVIGDSVQSSDTTVTHYLGESLRRLPNENESLTLKFEGSLVDADYLMEADVSHTFSYNESASTLSVQTAELSDESCGLLASVPYTSGRNYLCFVQKEDERGVDYVQITRSYISQNRKYFYVYPQLNKAIQILIIETYVDNDAQQINLGITTCRIDSHLFIWNWTTETGNAHHAALIVNSEKPPSQTRTLTSDVAYNNVAARPYPVAFANKTLGIDLNVEGVVIDESQLVDQHAYMPTHGKLADILSLATLSGKGIHPLYRSPYGDFYQVAISSVNASKTELYWTPVTVTQKAVND